MGFSRASRWENLPPELILSVAERVTLLDVVRARGVCRQWAQVLRKTSGVLEPRTFPFLILSSEQGERSESCTLLSLPDRRCYRVSPLPEIRDRRFIGSKGNWLVTLNLFLEPRFLNPLTREEVALPSLIDIPDPKYRDMYIRLDSSTWIGFYYPSNQTPIPYPVNLFRDICIRKIVPSSDDGPPGVALVAYGFGLSVKLALARPGDRAWTRVPMPPPVLECFNDAVYNAKDGRFYVVTRFGEVLAFHPDNLEHVTRISKIDDHHLCHDKNYLVFSDDNDLLLVERRIGWDGTCTKIRDHHFVLGTHTKEFAVFKFNRKWEQDDLAFEEWTRLDHLNGRCLMLGGNHSICLSPEQVPGLKGNCIYFTDDSPDRLISRDYRDHPRDVGVFDMELHSIDRFVTDYSSHNWPPPIWFLPSLH